MLTYDDLLDPGKSHGETFIQTVSVAVPTSTYKVGKNKWKSTYHKQEIQPNISGKMSPWILVIPMRS